MACFISRQSKCSCLPWGWSEGRGTAYKFCLALQGIFNIFLVIMLL